MVHLLQRRFRWVILATVAALSLLVLVALPSVGHAKGGTMAVRTDPGLDSVELEFFLRSLGVMGILHNNFNASTGCSGPITRTYLGARYFFKEPKASWYLGALSHSNVLPTGTTCSGSALTDGLELMVGHHWILGPGFAVDLGYRPNYIAIGWAF